MVLKEMDKERVIERIMRLGIEARGETDISKLEQIAVKTLEDDEKQRYTIKPCNVSRNALLELFSKQLENSPSTLYFYTYIKDVLEIVKVKATDIDTLLAKYTSGYLCYRDMLPHLEGNCK
jgi:hypothetical protein